MGCDSGNSQSGIKATTEAVCQTPTVECTPKVHSWDATSTAPQSLVLLRTQNGKADSSPCLHPFNQDHSTEPFAILPAIPSLPKTPSLFQPSSPHG